MLETGDVIKQSGKELLGALPKDSKMFQVMNQIMNQIYWVNASLKSISPVNGMVHNVPLTDFDSFEIGEPAPPAPPSPPSIPIPTPQPGTSQTTTKKGRQLLHLAVKSNRLRARWRKKRRMVMVGMKVQVAKRKGSQKKSELAFMNLVTKISTQSTGAIRLISKIQDKHQKGCPYSFYP